MQTKSWMSLLAVSTVMMAGSACHEWGESDPPAADDIFPSLENVAVYNFDEEPDPFLFKLNAYNNGEIPTIVDDEQKGTVLSLNNGYVEMQNPLKAVNVQNAVSLTFWMKQDATPDAETGEVPAQDLTGALIGFENENATGKMFFTANGWISYDGVDGKWNENDPSVYKTGYMPAGEWHYVALIIRNSGYAIYVDGEKKTDQVVTGFDCSKIVKFMNKVNTLYIGHGADTQTAPWFIDDLKIYRNAITDKEIARPNLGGGGSGPGSNDNIDPIEPVFFNSFDGGLNGCTIIGSGEIKYIGGAYGNVFSNGMNGMRENYLLLPEDALSHSAETQALTICFWVNRGNETESAHYNWSPIFSAYAAAPAPDNGMPMMVCQYRGILQENCNGWSDYTNDQNVNGVNAIYHNDTGADWLADGKWHYYTATFTPTNAKVYFDGKIINEWEIDGVNNTAAGMLTDGHLLKYICLGGNQAWNWADPDPGFWFDDLAIYNQELSEAQINNIMGLKTNVIYGNTFSGNAGDATLMGNGQFITNPTAGFGTIFKNAVGGMRENYLLLPENSLSKIADTEELTVSMWINSTDAGDYFWNPIFTAYAEMPGGNGCPMFACQYRGVVSVNTNGPDNSGDTWCDYGDDICDNPPVILYHGDLDWLADKQWHFYTATFTPTRAIVYFDGNVANSWTLDGVSRGQICDLRTVATLKCICLGGNQAWNWGDPDPGFGFDDLMIYNKVLTPDEIKQIMLLKK